MRPLLLHLYHSVRIEADHETYSSKDVAREETILLLRVQKAAR